MANRLGSSGGGSSNLTAPIDYITSLFWGFINFSMFIDIIYHTILFFFISVVIFFSTMLNMEPPKNATGGNRTGRGGGPGGGPGGPKKLGGMKDLQ